MTPAALAGKTVVIATLVCFGSLALWRLLVALGDWAERKTKEEELADLTLDEFFDRIDQHQ